MTTRCVSGKREEVVERVGQKPYFVGERGSEFSSRSRRRSRTLTAGQRREMRRYLGPSPAYLPGFGMGITISVFQMEGMLEWL